MVTVKPFIIDRYEVSVGQFAEFVRATNFKTEADVYKWSFVYDGFLSEPERAKTDSWVSDAPWWAQVCMCVCVCVCVCVCSRSLFLSLSLFPVLAVSRYLSLHTLCVCS